MTNATQACRRKNLIASIALYPMSTDQLRSRFPNCSGLPELLSDMAAAGLVHSVRTAQAETWHPGPRP